MCRRVSCPNDGKPTWWGCGKHVETALDGVPKEDRCDCPHEPVDGNPSMFEVKPTGSADKKIDESDAPQQPSGGGACIVM